MKSKFFVKIDLGENYDFGKNPWQAELELEVRLLSNGSIINTFGPISFQIDQDHPEQLAVFNIPFIQTLARDEIQIESISDNTSPLIDPFLRIQVWFENDYKFVVDNTIVNLQAPTNNLNSTTFDWTPDCNCTPNYEFQLLRLHNTDISATNEITVIAEVDWSRALTIETQNFDPSLTLTLTEGTGYYLWRVRPISNKEPGGIANSLNWGQWSDQAYWDNLANNGDIISLNSPIGLPPQIFFYEQFDVDKNWIYSRSFSEAEPNGKIKIAEGMTYANGLLQVSQNQRHLYSQENIVVQKTLQDYSGRPAMNTLNTPIVGQDHLGYVSNFMVDPSNNSYDPSNFDDNHNYKDPEPVSNGALNDYYSDVNTDPRIPSAEGYPYTRTLYYGDGIGRVKEASGVGKALRLNTDPTEASHTTRFYYSGVSNTELVRVFGDEAPKASNVIKMLTVDPNQTISVSYQDKNGQVLATCLSANDNSAHHDPLPSRDSFTVEDTISGNVPCGDGCLLAGKTVSFATPTSIDLNYTLTPQTVDELCFNTCSTCDYRIQFSIKRLDDPYDPTFPVIFPEELLPPDLCNNFQSFTWSQTYALPPGTFFIERKIYLNNVAPATVVPTTNPFGTTYLSQQISQLTADLQTEVENDPLWTMIETYLINGQTEDLYDELILNHGLSPTVDTFAFTAACCEFVLPIIRCESCPIQQQDFEAYFDGIYPYNSADPSLTPAADNPNSNELEYLPGFQIGELNTMVQNMLNETQYDEEDLCDCWVASVQSWEGLINLGNTSADYEADLLEVFLNCTGRKYNPPSTTPIQHPSTEAYNWTYTIGSSPYCEQAICISSNDAQSPFFGASIDCNAGMIDWSAPYSLNQEQWGAFYNCTQSIGSPLPAQQASSAINQSLLQMETACNDACEDRFSSFIVALEHYYEMELGASVEIDCPNPPSFPIDPGECVPMSSLYCQAAQLVDLCKDNCQSFSPVFDANNSIIGYGTQAEIEAYQQAMYYAFDLVQAAPNGDCPPGYTVSTADSDLPFITGQDFADQAVQYLNTQWTAFVNNSIDGASFNLTAALNNFQAGLGDICSSDSFPPANNDILIPATDSSYFEANNCQLIWHRPGQIKPLIICNNICQGVELQCGIICLKWLIPDQNSLDPFVFTYLSCEEQTADHSLILLSQQLNQCKDQQVENLEQTYLKKCADPDSIKDLFTISYTLAYYHYTLYYYDRAGKLVQTVAPEGVDESSISRQDVPPHDFRTQYRYNSLGQLIWQRSPDGGETHFYYDDVGQLRFSQNAQQALDGTYAYTKYDHLGRIIEVGKAATLIPSLTNANDPIYPANGSERIFTVYTNPYPGPLSQGKAQRYLSNRVSYSYTEEGVSTIYSYDPHGNVEWLIQDIMPELQMNDPSNRQFLIEYEYDLISNQVRRLNFQTGRADQFFTAYRYDEDNRITEVRTSRDGYLWDRDARYIYYDHGPLARMLLGEDEVQGMDYVYTIQGWLKSINSPLLLPATDPGKDGANNSSTAKDAFGSGLNYFAGDFVKGGSFFQDPFFNFGLEADRNLYNGNITMWLSNSAVAGLDPDYKYPGLTGRLFHYDELNRITKSDFRFWQSGTNWQDTDEYDSDYSYDANGNLLELNRNAYELNFGQTKMDELHYVYHTQSTLAGNKPTNQLRRVRDCAHFICGSDYVNDLEKTTRYQYDAIGNLIKEEPTQFGAPDIDVVWNLMGKAKQVVRSDGLELNFRYDAQGNRVLKKVLQTNGDTDYNWYVRDATGNILAIYKLDENINGNWQTVQEEVPIYGSDRLGIHNSQTIAFGYNSQTQDQVYEVSSDLFFTRYLGQKAYELSDHLGNVQLTLSDIKLAVLNGQGPVNFSGDILGAQEYYPFGSLMGGLGVSGYRFGFQNQERVDEIAGAGNHYTAEFWEYSPILGKRWNTDPVVKPHESPYAAFANNPIWFIDPNGADTLDINKNDKGKWTIANTQTAKGDDVFRVKNGDETKTYTFSEGEYGKRFNVLNLENNDKYTLGVYHVSGQDGEGASGFAITPGGTASTKVGSGKRLPDDTYTLSGTGNGKDQYAYKWVQPLLHTGENGGYVGGRGVKIHPAPSKAVETEVGQWTAACYVVCTDYKLYSGEIIKYNSKLSIKTSKHINTMLGGTTHYNAIGKKSRPGSDFSNGIKFKLIQKTGF
ncbi:MAG: hypothetical protein AAF927_03655 [Bacteroidota bacterium]